MRRAIAAALAACLLLSACGGDHTPPADGREASAAYTAAQIAWAVWKSRGENLPAESAGLTPEDPGFDGYLRDYYRLDPETVEDGCLRFAGGMDAFELAVLRFREGTDMEAAAAALTAYRGARAGDFTGYLPEQASLAEAGAVVTRGNWAALLLCAGPEEAAELFRTCLSSDAPSPEDPDWPDDTEPESPESTPEPEQAPEQTPNQNPEQALGQNPERIPEQTPDQSQGKSPDQNPGQGTEIKPDTPPAPPVSAAYDGQAVRDAWASGDTAGLSEKSLAVLDAVRQVIREQIRPEMSAYEKELAIHDWMLDWGSYDHEILSHLEGDGGTPDNENPYGFLIHRKGICRGYASTFQLFMDVMGIECRTVEGAAHGGTDEHAWNLVQLEGDWYAVDVTWDDPTGSGNLSEALRHKYFNVTSQYLREHDHQWTAEAPEAEGTALAFLNGA